MAMTALEAAQQTAEPIVTKGSKFMFGDEASAVAEAEGYPNGFALYFAGRAGVLGDVDVTQVVSAFAWWEPALVAKMYSRGVAVKPPHEAATDFARACHEWGENNLATLAGTETVATLGRKVIDAATPIGAALYTGWRALPVPDSAPAAAALAIQTLRELRGDLHMQAVAVEGLTVLEAVSTHGGAERSKMFGWPAPAEDTEALRARWNKAEDTTNAMTSTYFEVLTETEREQFTAAVKASAG